MKEEYVKPCPNCKLFSMYLNDPCYIWYGQLLKQYICDECGHEEII
ncbi:hypothetical protein EA82_00750 [Enterococcus hirae]|nr:hypothetical protein EA82_00750 [Enterococcus hirae]VTX87753.1 Uncharacterised protein [Enterococcus hirae]